MAIKLVIDNLAGTSSAELSRLIQYLELEIRHRYPARLSDEERALVAGTGPGPIIENHAVDDLNHAVDQLVDTAADLVQASQSTMTELRNAPATMQTTGLNERLPESVNTLNDMSDDDALAILTGENTQPQSNITGEIDSEGLPWDARIHSEKKSKIANGTWRLKRGIDPAQVELVKSELKAVAAIPAPPANPFAEVFGGANVPLPPSLTGASAETTGYTSCPASTQDTTATSASPSDEPITFQELMTAITGAIRAGTLTRVDVQTAIAETGLPALPLLSSRVDLIPGVVAKLGLEIERATVSE